MIVLYNPKSTDSYKKPLPMSLLALGSMLEGRREYTIVDANLGPGAVDSIIDLGRSSKLEAIGVTVMPGPQLLEAVSDSRKLKASLPGVPIVWGGFFPSLHPESVLTDAAIDFVVSGQGEQTFVDLLDVLEAGGDLATVAGLVYRPEGRTGDAQRNVRRSLLELDDLPDWPYDQLPMERYLRDHYLGRRVADHHSSYGCPFGCNFCAIVPIVERQWVGQSSERVASIVGSLQERYGIDALQFHDMDFFISEARTKEIADAIRTLGLTWWALGRVDELSRYRDSTWQAMVDSGLKMVFCGAESGSDETLKRMNKGGAVATEKTLELAKRMRSYGVVPEFSFVLGNPPDPAADIDSTLSFIRRLKTANPDTEVILYMYTPVPLDGVLFDEAREMGFEYPKTLDEWISGEWRAFDLRRNPHTPWRQPRLQRRVRNFERVLNAYYPTVTDRGLSGPKRAILRALGAWRYKTQIYEMPLELAAFHRLFGYQRPETAGF